MSKIFLIGNTYFQNDLATKKLVEQWNAFVEHTDTIIHLGNVTTDINALSVISTISAKKILIKGLDDRFSLHHYIRHFRDIYSYYVIDNYILSHYPIHPYCKKNYSGNIFCSGFVDDNKEKWYYKLDTLNLSEMSAVLTNINKEKEQNYCRWNHE